MDTNSLNSGTAGAGKQEKVFRLVLFLLVALFAGLSGFLYFKQGDLKKQIALAEKDKNEAIQKTDVFEKKLQVLVARYDSLILAHDGLKEELLAERNKVVVLMADYQALKRQGNQGVSHASNDAYFKSKYQQLQKEFDANQTIILDLKSKNQELTAENFTKIKELEDATAKNDQIKQENNKLNKIVEIAKRLKTFNLYADGVKASGSKEKSTTKASKVNRIRACFTILDNQLSEKQEKYIYLVIKDPSDKIFTEGDAKFTLNNGTETQYSLKKNIFYDNKVMDICLQYNIKQLESLEKGKYKVQIYADGIVIGETSFSLK